MIPNSWASDTEDGMREAVVIPDKTPVEFVIESCEEDTQNFRGEPAAIWSMRISCISGNLKATVWHNIYKDGKATVWNDLDRNGSPWIQNKFLNLCSAVGLRRSGDDININPMWFTEPGCFIGKRGRAVVGVETWQDKARNRINWFNTPSEQQAMHNDAINSQIFIAPVPSSQTRIVSNMDDPFA